MIHHLARAFFVRNTAAQDAAQTPSGAPSGDQKPTGSPAPRPIKARPITPWGTPSRTPANPGSSKVVALRPTTGQSAHADMRKVRICTDPADARRTVITGRFAEVCAALDRLVMEQEAAA